MSKTITAARLQNQYTTVIRKEIVDELKLSNLHEAPVLEKIIVNVGLEIGRAHV